MPPNIRDTIGVGTFLLSFYNLKKKSVVESFLIEKCLIGEFKELYEGCEFAINGQNYFLQSRMIAHLFDLAQLCPFCGIQSMQNSLAGCAKCNLCKGVSITMKDKNNKNTSTTRYLDKRQSLPLAHYLRYSGISRNDKSNDPIEIPVIPNTLGYSEREVDYRTMKLFETNKSRFNKILKFLTYKGREKYLFFGTDIADFTDFKDHLYYNSCWLGPFVKHISTTTEDMIERQNILRENNNLDAFETVKGDGLLFKFPGFNWKSDIKVDIDHAIKGFYHDVMFKKAMSNNEKHPLITDKVKRYYNNLGLQMFPLLIETQTPKCSFTKGETSLAQCTLKCLLIPIGCSSKLVICKGNIFDSPGQIQISNCITIWSVYLNLLLSCSSNISHHYKQYYRYLSDVLIRLRSPDPYKIDVDILKIRITELESLTEGLFPVNVMTYMLHALLDICENIHDHGTTIETHCLVAERHVGTSKRLVKIRGGTNYVQMAYKKYFGKEQTTTTSFYENFYENLKKDKGTSLLSINDNNTIVYNPRIHSLTNHYKIDVEILEYEFEAIVIFIKKILLKMVDDDRDECMKRSSFFRVMVFLDKQKRNNESTYQCIYRMINHIKEKENDNIYSCLISMDSNPSENERIRLILFIRKHKYISESLFDCIHRLYKNIDFRGKKSIVYDCLQHIYQTVNDEKQVNNIEGVNYTVSICPSDMLSFYNNSFGILHYDYLSLQYIVENMIEKVKISEHAIIHGINHYGRGFRCSSKAKNDIDNLSEVWFHKNQYSSWCKIEEKLYGQLNYFLSPNLPTDKMASELLIVSVSCRKVLVPDFSSGNNNLHLNMNSIHCTSSVRRSPLFLSFDNILPTRVVTIGYQKQNIRNSTLKYFAPIYCSDKAQSDIQAHISKRLVILRQNCKITYLGLLDVNPENLIKPESDIMHECVRTMHDI